MSKIRNAIKLIAISELIRAAKADVLCQEGFEVVK
jgi:hypothetical protein